jgi:hypothetical protein
MAKKNQMEWAYFDASLDKQPCFEFGMKYGDAKQCSHMGRCDDDCEAMNSVPYIRKQLDNLTNAQMEAAIREYGVEFEEHEGREVPRETLELYIVWLAAGDIVDDVYERENRKAA